MILAHISPDFIIGGFSPLCLMVLFSALNFFQFKLSKNKEKMWGLIIPIIAFIMFLVLFIGYFIIGFDNLSKHGQIICYHIFQITGFFFISAIVNLVIYYRCRKTSEIDLDKLNIQDLN